MSGILPNRDGNDATCAKRRFCGGMGINNRDITVPPVSAPGRMSLVPGGPTPVKEPPGYVFSELREGEFTLSRGAGDGLEPILLAAPVGDVSPRESVKRLEHEYALREALEPDWAARPTSQAPRFGKHTWWKLKSAVRPAASAGGSLPVSSFGQRETFSIFQYAAESTP